MWYWLALWVTDFLVLSEVEINIYLKLKHLVEDSLDLPHQQVHAGMMWFPLCWDRVLVLQFVHRSLLSGAAFTPGMHLKLVNTALQNLFSHHCAARRT